MTILLEIKIQGSAWTYSRRCQSGNSGPRAPTGWRTLCQTLQWRSGQECQGRSLHNTEPVNKTKQKKSLKIQLHNSL